MARASGIGTYLRNVVPRLFAGEGGPRPVFLGDEKDLRRLLEPHVSGAAYEECTSPIYSAREQLRLRAKTPVDADLFWSPHYNIPLLLRHRLLVTVHDVLHLARPEYVRGWHRRAYARGMFAAVRSRSTRIICGSRFTADELVRLTGIERSRLTVVHYGVDEGWFMPCVDAPPHPKPYFVYLGNIKPHKNLRRLCSAFGRLIDEIPHDLVLIGRRDGFIHGERDFATVAARFGERLCFTGELPDDAVRRYVGHATAVVLPSRYEGFGLPALEAMAAGRAVAVSSAASLPEVCGDAAVYFDPDREEEIASALRTLARDGALRDELGQAGRERARTFTWDRCAAETREVIEAALGG
jgi:glycosyltransferase involved in cell wall biosynthesis